MDRPHCCDHREVTTSPVRDEFMWSHRHIAASWVIKVLIFACESVFVIRRSSKLVVGKTYKILLWSDPHRSSSAKRRESFQKLAESSPESPRPIRGYSACVVAIEPSIDLSGLELRVLYLSMISEFVCWQIRTQVPANEALMSKGVLC
jgi:hypothetical protein